MHQEAYDFVQVVAPNRTPGPVLEIGSRDVNGSIRGLFKSSRHYFGIDIAPGPGVDIVADGATFSPIEHGIQVPFGTIVCCEVLEHTFDGESICKNAYKLLMKGGMFIITTAGPTRRPHSAIDGGELHIGEFYCNITDEELRDWLRQFKVVETMENRNQQDLYAIAYK